MNTFDYWFDYIVRNGNFHNTKAYAVCSHPYFRRKEWYIEGKNGYAYKAYYSGNKRTKGEKRIYVVNEKRMERKTLKKEDFINWIDHKLLKDLTGFFHT